MSDLVREKLERARDLTVPDEARRLMGDFVSQERVIIEIRVNINAALAILDKQGETDD